MILLHRGNRAGPGEMSSPYAYGTGRAVTDIC